MHSDERVIEQMEIDETGVETDDDGMFGICESMTGKRKTEQFFLCMQSNVQRFITSDQTEENNFHFF